MYLRQASCGPPEHIYNNFFQTPESGPILPEK